MSRTTAQIRQPAHSAKPAEARSPRLRSQRGVGLALVAALTLAVVPASAGQTREAQIVSEQAEKAKDLRPYEPTAAERWVERASAALAGPPQGVYPWFGSIYPGGLFAAGPGVRLPFGRGGALEAQAAWSLRSYKLARAVLTLPPFADRRLRITVHAHGIDAPSVSFSGLGDESDTLNKTGFHFRPVTVGATFLATPTRHIALGGGVDHLTATTKRVTRGTATEDLFSEAAVPGLGASPRYLVTRGHASYDWRDSPGYSRRGGYYALDWSAYHQRDGDAFSFRRLDADVRQLIPILRANWVIALRAAASTTYADEGNETPYFLMPQLGGGSDLRGYSTWRFRDQHRVLFSAEYRWTPSHFVDMALFHDAGKVTATRAELGFRGLRHTNGIGIRFHAPNATLLRIELARGAEGTALIFAFGQNF